MLIREVILENFMSYDYARIPLRPGVNVICGPNGAGKSSLLLGVSVALGQSYTERSKKLSDLIRWGRDSARVTLVLDNSPRGKRRPVPRINRDSIRLTRVLRRDGKYWFELENKAVTKADVTRLLSSFSVDPDNMLVIMHQNMVDQFSVLSAQEKLRIVEAAVGLEAYRQNVLKARQKLSRILSEEESVGKLLESAEQTLRYWREQYDRYQEKKQLRLKRKFLERELAWAEVSKREKVFSELKEHVQERQREIQQIEKERENIRGKLKACQEELENLRIDWRKLLEERINLERGKARRELEISSANQTLEEIQSWIESSQEQVVEFLSGIEKLEATTLRAQSNPSNLGPHLTEIKGNYEKLERLWTQRLDVKKGDLKGLIEKSGAQLMELGPQIAGVQEKVGALDSKMEGIHSDVLDHKISLALLQYREKTLVRDMQKLNKDLQNMGLELEDVTKRAETGGPRLVSLKTIDEILDEMRMTDGHLVALADVSEDVERMYESYSKLYLELKEKAQMVAENREKALEEVKTRMESWKNVIQNLLDHVNLRYSTILLGAQATGMVQLTSTQDIEEAGLEMLVGFKGTKPVPLDAYTQSGGERSTAIMAFLLALQQHIRSPFRAVDEYDTHMDPKNREVIANVLISSVGDSDAQYVAITPSQITFTGKNVHIITVQNVEGTSLIKELV